MIHLLLNLALGLFFLALAMPFLLFFAVIAVGILALSAFVLSVALYPALVVLAGIVSVAAQILTPKEKPA